MCWLASVGGVEVCELGWCRLRCALATRAAAAWRCCHCVHVGAAVSWVVHRWKTRPVRLFERARQEAAEGRLHLESAVVLKGIYR